MNKLILFAAVLGFTSLGQAEGEMTHSAEFRLRSAVRTGNDLTNDNTINGTEHRFKLRNDYKASDRFSARLTLLHNAIWGASADTDIFNGTNPSTINQTTSNNFLAVNEAFLTWRVNDELTIKAGRGTYELADGSLVAVNDFQRGMTAFDGAAAVYELEVARITASAIKFAEYDSLFNATSSNADSEANSFGLNADLKFAPEIFNIMNVYAIHVKRDPTDLTTLPGTGVPPRPTTVPRPKESYTRYGLTLAGTVADMVNFKVNYHGYTGDSGDNDKKGQMYEAEAGVTLEEVNNLNFYVGYHVDSGDTDGAGNDDEHYDSFFYDIHNNAGLMDIVRWGNLTYIKAGVSADVLENLNLGLHYHMFTATEAEGRTDIPNLNNGLGVPAGLSTDDEIGSEIDFIATHKYDGGFEIEARYGIFMAGDRLGANPEDVQEFFLQGTLKF